MAARDVLLVDDDPDCLLVVSTMLRTQGFSVRTANGGRQALIEIDRRRPDVVLLDMNMPGMSGIEVLEQLRADPERSTLPVILLTARDADDDLLFGYQHGADYYIPKPCSGQQIIHGISIVLGLVRDNPASAA